MAMKEEEGKDLYIDIEMNCRLSEISRNWLGGGSSSSIFTSLCPPSPVGRYSFRDEIPSSFTLHA